MDDYYKQDPNIAHAPPQHPHSSQPHPQSHQNRPQQSHQQPPQQQQQQQQQHQRHASQPSTGGPGMAAPQLPPQMFTTAAQLLDLTDKKLLVALRDGRKLVGVLRSWDQFANIVLQDTTERIFSHTTSTSNHPPRGLYADISRGTYLVRGENVQLIGEIDLDKDDEAPPGYELAPPPQVFALQKREKEEQRRKDRGRQAILGRIGFEGELAGGAEGAMI